MQDLSDRAGNSREIDRLADRKLDSDLSLLETFVPTRCSDVTLRMLQASWLSRYLSASMAAMQPVPAAVTAWR